MSQPHQPRRHRSPLHGPWRWVPSLYFIEGLPNVIVVTLSVVMYKRLGLPNEDITFYTSWLYLPWLIKPFWSPLVETFGSRRSWVLTMQWVMGAAMATLAFALPLGGYVKWTLALFWLIAFSSATHDIAADGYYMERLTPRQQSFFVGIRSTFYRIAMIAGQGLLLMFVGRLEILTKSPVKPWMVTFVCVGVLLMLFAVYHSRALRPSRSENAPRLSRNFLASYFVVIGRFFIKPGVLAALLFMMFYLMPEALLTKICPL
ncbi:MAG: MFS transporter, partial [Alloprevotella sp.]